MKNKRYLTEAISRLRATTDVDMTDEQISKLVLAVYDFCQDVALDNSSEITVDFDDDTLLKSYEAAHAADITLNQFIERALENAIAEDQ